jgi:hypothetical protein
METIAEWEAEKKAKARRQKELKDEVNGCLEVNTLAYNILFRSMRLLKRNV